MPVATYSHRVLVDGVEIPASSIAWECEAGFDLPGRLSTTTGLGQRKGTVNWVHPENVGAGWNPWDKGYPSPGSGVEVFASLNGAETKVFTGKIDVTETTVYGNTVSRLVDFSDDLNREVTVRPLLDRMPGRQNTANPLLSVGASARYVVDRVLRECGYSSAEGSLSVPGEGLVFYAPLQGTMWTDWERGEGAIDFARRSSGSANTVLPVFVRSGYDVFLREGYAQWGKSPRIEWKSGSQDLVFRVRVGRDHSGTADFTAVTGIFGNVVLRVAGRKVSVLVNNVDQGASITLPSKTCWVGAELKKSNIVLYILESGESSWSDYKGGKPGNEFVDNFLISATGASAVSHWSVRVVDNGSSPFIWNGFGVEKIYGEKRQAVVNLPSWSDKMAFIKSIRSRNALEVLKEIAEALCCMMWYDGEGRLHIEYAGDLRKGFPTGNLEISSMTDAPVKSDILMTAQEVRTKGLNGFLCRTKNQQGASVTLWQGSGETLDAGEELKIFAEIPEDEDWFEVDASFARFQNDNSHLNDIKNQSGSVYVTEMTGQWWGDNDFKFEEITPFVFKMTCKAGALPCALNIPRQVPEIPDWLAGDKTPIIRGGAKIQYIDQPYAYAKTDATNAPILEHDMGIWGQGELSLNMAREIAQYCGKEYATYLRSVKHFLQPELDIGQVLFLDLNEPYGKRFIVMITGISHDSASDASSLTIRIVRDVTPWSYDELARSYNTYSELESKTSYNLLGNRNT